MTIRLTDAAKYFDSLPHQKKAFEYLQSIMTSEELGIFAHKFRTPLPGLPPNPRMAKAVAIRPPAKNRVEFAKIIKARLDQLGIKLYTGGSKGYGYTVIGVEGVNLDLSRNSDSPDKWNDIGFGVKAYPDNTWKIIGPFPCTTEPGRHYTVNPLNINGAAYPKLDFKHNAIWQFGTHRKDGFCLVQTGGPITVVRDSNRDGKRSSNEKEFSGFFGCNLHSTNGNWNKNSIGRWGAGCNVYPNPQHKNALVNGFLESKQNKCSYVLLSNKL